MIIRNLLVYAGVLLIVAGCTKPAPAPPPIAAPTSDTTERSFDEAVNVATDGLVTQLQQRPGPSAKTEARRSLVIDPMVDAVSGQQTAATLLLEQPEIRAVEAEMPGIFAGENGVGLRARGDEDRPGGHRAGERLQAAGRAGPARLRDHRGLVRASVRGLRWSRRSHRPGPA